MWRGERLCELFISFSSFVEIDSAVIADYLKRNCCLRKEIWEERKCSVNKTVFGGIRVFWVMNLTEICEAILEYWLITGAEDQWLLTVTLVLYVLLVLITGFLFQTEMFLVFAVYDEMLAKRTRVWTDVFLCIAWNKLMDEPKAYNCWLVVFTSASQNRIERSRPIFTMLFQHIWWTSLYKIP